MKHQKTATVFAVLAAVTALIPVGWAIFEETQSLFSVFPSKILTILSVAVVQLLFAVGCLPPKREKLIPWMMLFPAGLSLVNSVFLFSSIWQIGLYATLARPIAGVTLLLFLLCITSFRLIWKRQPCKGFHKLIDAIHFEGRTEVTREQFSAFDCLCNRILRQRFFL